MEPPRTPLSFRFGLFEADLATGELRKNGRRVKLQEQPFQLLALLVQRAGQIVQRDELQKALWPVDTFVEFDQAVNTAIKKIRKALGDSAENPRFIETLPRKGYRFVAPITNPVVSALPSVSAQPPRFGPSRIAGFIAIALIVAATWFIAIRRRPEVVSPPPVPLTTYLGEERGASFSPDGNRLAFAWNGEKRDNFDIYVKLIGSETLLRITSDSGQDFSPAWSPDGRSIAFLRTLNATRTGVFLIPAVGGAERKLSEVDCCGASIDRNLVWSPDGNWLATADRSSDGERRNVFLVSPEDGEKTRLTSSQPSWLDDRTPAFSPDGRQLAFVREKNAGVSELFVVPFTPGGQSSREARPVTFGNGWIRALTWSADGGSLIFSSYRGENNTWLWRLRFPAGGAPERLGALGDHSFEPAIAPQLGSLVYTRQIPRADTWQLELPAPGRKASEPVKLLSSTRGDFNAQYSPDGKHIVFHSTRSGWSEVWVCDSNGSNARQLTFLKAPLTGSPRWAPDGNHIVFDSNIEGNFELYTIAVEGGKPRRLTTNPSDDGVASWSRDGKAIYFASDRSGKWQIWKVPAEGGAPVQITRHGGNVAFESLDQAFVYYSKGRFETSLWKVPAGGGEEQEVLQSIWWLNFAVVRDGIFFRPGHGDGLWSLRFFSFRTGATTLVAPIEGTADVGLSVSPDGRHILYSQSDQQNSELMLVEKFR